MQTNNVAGTKHEKRTIIRERITITMVPGRRTYGRSEMIWHWSPIEQTEKRAHFITYREEYKVVF